MKTAQSISAPGRLEGLHAAVSTRFYAGAEIADELAALGVAVRVFRAACELEAMPADFQPDLVLEINLHEDVHAACARHGWPYAAWAFDSGVTLLPRQVLRATDRFFLHNRGDVTKHQTLHPHVKFLPFSAGRMFHRPPRTDGFAFDVLAILNTCHKAVDQGEVQYRETLRQIPAGSEARAKFEALHSITEELVESHIDRLSENGLRQDLEARLTRHAIPFFDGAPVKLDAFAQGVGQILAFRQRLRVMRELGRVCGVDVFGDAYWRQVAADCPGLRYRGWAGYWQLPELYNSTRITVNLTQPQCMESIPQRVFHVLAAGGFVLTNAGSVLTEYFRPGLHLEVFESIPELCDKVRFYLAHPERRTEIADQGREEFLRRHTMRQRLEEIAGACAAAG